MSLHLSFAYEAILVKLYQVPPAKDGHIVMLPPKSNLNGCQKVAGDRSGGKEGKRLQPSLRFCLFKGNDANYNLKQHGFPN